MSINPLGEASIAAYNPSLVAAIAAGEATISATLPGLSAQLAAALQAVAQLTLTPPTLAVQLASAVALVAAITAAIAVGDPGISGSLTALTALIASLTIEVGILEAQVEAFASLTIGLTGFGVEAWTFAGQCNEFATEIGAFTNAGFAGGSPTTASNVLVFGVTNPAIWATLTTVLGVPSG